MAKSPDEREFKKSLECYLPNSWVWKPPDFGGPLEDSGRRFESGRPADFLVHVMTEEGPVFALMELKRFKKRSITMKDLRPAQIVGLKSVERAGGLSLVCFHGLFPDQESKMFLIPYGDIEAVGTLKVEGYPSCPRTKIKAPTVSNVNRTMLGWDLRPLIDLMKVHSIRMRDPKCWKKYL